ncbi:LPS-assembly protein LptD [Neisseria leonii]|uniref:LPS-assembly protein LptD n=1 Tax=Neisseria leonii TaxID=2995413 RepID=A0A9X4E2G9_9NEIS|nr:LPS-assembly protein LptD [Neisseria sp. 51.81]MDD9327529.1 LPS-assembly protein LptD [Neisseria sp. 51.81]
MARLFLVKPMVFAVGMALGGTVAAADTPLGRTCLSCSPQDLPAGPEVSVRRSGQAALPQDYTRITADAVEGQSQVKVRASGDVIVERNAQTLNADWVDYDQAGDTVTAGERFVLEDNGAVVSGEKLEYRLDGSSGRAENADMVVEQDGRRLQAASRLAEVAGDGRYQLKDVMFNTCERGDASWYIRADSVEADYGTGIGVAKNARLVFGGVPVMYTPWADFPLNGNRKSGFLVPDLSIGSDGTEVNLPYYFNLAPNYDATLNVGGISSRGMRLGGEFRYLEPAYTGTAAVTWLPYDRRRKQSNRYHLQWQHSQQLAPNLSLGVDYNLVSDDDYARDFYRYDAASNVNYNRQVWLNHQTEIAGGRLESSAMAQNYQTLADKNGYKNKPYAIMPRVSGRWQRHWGGTQADIFAQFTRFDHQERQNGSRSVLYPSISHDFRNSWGHIRPKFGVHYTYYALSGFGSRAARSRSRTLPVFNIDAGLTFERDTALFGRAYLQTLEPRFFYNYIPAKAQNDLPNFDTSENSASYEQLFRENLYSGQDRINAANSLTAALQTRYLDKQSGGERLRAGIGQKYYFTTDNVQLDGSVARTSRSRSDSFGFVEGRLTDSISTHAAVHYNDDQGRVEKMSAGLLYRPQAGKVLSMRYQYGRHEPIYLESNGAYYYGKLRQIDLAAQWPLSRNLYGVARFNYALNVNRALDTVLGLEYRSGCGCWSGSVLAQRYVTGIDANKNSTYKNAVFLTLQLKDLSNIGQKTGDILNRAVPGYVKTNEVVNR